MNLRYLRLITLFAVGFAGAIPLPLTGSVLTLRLIDEGVSKSLIAWFVLMHIPFSLKLLWAPLIDNYPVPFFHSLGQRKSWMMLTLCCMCLSLFGIGYFHPIHHYFIFSALLALASLFAGAVYMIGLSYEMESLEESEYAQGSAFVITGYRLGLFIGGAFTLYLAELINWSYAYFVISALVALTIFLVSLMPEPFKSSAILLEKKSRKQNWFVESFLLPLKEFFYRPSWVFILLFLFFYKIGDNFAGSMTGPFYREIGFTKSDIANVAKIFGMIATFCGAFCGAHLVKKMGLMTCLLFGGLLHAFSLSLNVILAYMGKDIGLLYSIITLEHMTSGIAMTAFISTLWKLCNAQFASVQYAILWSFVSLKKSIISAAGAWLASTTDWTVFFSCVSINAIIGVSIAFMSLKFCYKNIKYKASDYF